MIEEETSVASPRLGPVVVVVVVVRRPHTVVLLEPQGSEMSIIFNIEQKREDVQDATSTRISL